MKNINLSQALVTAMFTVLISFICYKVYFTYEMSRLKKNFPIKNVELSKTVNGDPCDNGYGGEKCREILKLQLNGTFKNYWIKKEDYLGNGEFVFSLKDTLTTPYEEFEIAVTPDCNCNGNWEKRKVSNYQSQHH